MRPRKSKSEYDQLFRMLAAYGGAMAAAQVFEFDLAALSILAHRVKHPNKAIDSPEKAQRALEQQFAQFEHRLQRASAKELRNLLPEGLDQDLADEIDELIPIRNLLAHRYLREPVRRGARANFQKEIEELHALHARFSGVGDRLVAIMETYVQERGPNVSPEQFELLQALGTAAAAGLSLEAAVAAVRQGLGEGTG